MMSTTDPVKLRRLLTYLETDPGNQALLADALTLALELKDASASTLAQSIKALSTPSAPARFALSNWHMHKQDWQSAAHLLSALAVELPHNEPTLYNLAQCQAFQGDFASCFQTLKPWLKQQNCSPYTQILLARSAMHLSDYSSATQALTLALKTDATNIQAMGLLAIAYKDTQQIEQAKQLATQTLGLDPQSTEANLVLGELALENQNIPLAKTLFEQVLGHRNSFRALRGICMIQLINGEADKATNGLISLIESNSPLISDYHLLALAHLLLGAHQQALTSLRDAEKFEPNNQETNILSAIVTALAKGPDSHGSFSAAAMSSPLGIALNSLELGLKGDQENARELLTSIFEQQSPLGKTYGEVFSRLIKSQSAH